MLKEITNTIKNETKEQKGGFLSMLLGTLGASLLGNFIRKRNCKSWFWKRMGFLMPPHSLTNFEIQKYYEKEPRFNVVFSRDNLSKKIKDGAYVINLDEHADTGTHWIALFC